MSVLDLPRLVFSGDFQADVSTVNNDVRHYDVKTFEDRFQRPQTSAVRDGWWNPSGSGAFRLLDCTVRAVTYRDGTRAVAGSPDLPEPALRITGAAAQVSGKIVDVDPQWQLASEIWGLGVRLVGADGDPILTGAFEPAAFRDIYFGRQAGAAALNGQSASAVYTSRLVGVRREIPAGRSRLVDELLDAADDDTLAIRLTTFGYFTNSAQARFTLGRVLGVIAPGRAREPRRFCLGRRFAPANGNATPEAVGFFDAVVDPAARRVTVDLGNALPITDPFGTTAAIGPLAVAVLRTPDEPDGAPGVQEGQVVDAADVVTLGPIEYGGADWLLTTAGIVDLPLDDAAAALARDHPLALVQPAGPGARVVIRETFGGLVVRADDVVVRVDARKDRPEPVPIRLFAARWGVPLEDVDIRAQLRPPMSGQGGTGPDVPNPPPAAIPDINTPQAAVTVPASARTTAHGRAELVLTVSDPGRPRPYIDGQIYLVGYGLAAQAAQQRHRFDLVVLHVREAFTAPPRPNWADDIAELMRQYGNLYPIMSRRLVDLGDYDAVHENAAILELAFSREIDDPNHMPVARDLSEAKRAMILGWLRERDGSGARRMRHGPRPSPDVPIPPEPPQPQAADDDGEIGGKAHAVRQALDGLDRADRTGEG